MKMGRKNMGGRKRRKRKEKKRKVKKRKEKNRKKNQNLIAFELEHGMVLAAKARMQAHTE